MLADRHGLHDTSFLSVTVLKDLLLKNCCPCCPPCVFTVSLSHVPHKERVGGSQQVIQPTAGHTAAELALLQHCGDSGMPVRWVDTNASAQHNVHIVEPSGQWLVANLSSAHPALPLWGALLPHARCHCRYGRPDGARREVGLCRVAHAHMCGASGMWVEVLDLAQQNETDKWVAVLVLCLCVPQKPLGPRGWKPTLVNQPSIWHGPALNTLFVLVNGLPYRQDLYVQHSHAGCAHGTSPLPASMSHTAPTSPQRTGAHVLQRTSSHAISQHLLSCQPASAPTGVCASWRPRQPASYCHANRRPRQSAPTPTSVCAMRCVRQPAILRPLWVGILDSTGPGTAIQCAHEHTAIAASRPFNDCVVQTAPSRQRFADHDPKTTSAHPRELQRSTDSTRADF